MKKNVKKLFNKKLSRLRARKRTLIGILLELKSHENEVDITIPDLQFSLQSSLLLVAE